MAKVKMRSFEEEFEYGALRDSLSNKMGAPSSPMGTRQRKKLMETDLELLIPLNVKSYKIKKKRPGCKVQAPICDVPQVEQIKTELKDFEMEISFGADDDGDIPISVVDPLEETVDWPQGDLKELIRRIEIEIPEKDSLAFSTRVEKLNWDEIAFNNYSGEKCKRVWIFIQKKIRRFRILMELLQDAKALVTNSWPGFLQNKIKRHPDMPKKPLSSYMLFYMKKRDRILAENPGIDLPELSKIVGAMFKNISATKREKYLNLATEERRKYEQKLEEFYQSHPEIPRNSMGAIPRATDAGPKKPQTPFGLFFEQLTKTSNVEDDDRSCLKEQCKEQWKNLSDKKKVVWIDRALENESKYQEELKKYVVENPNFTPSTVKPVVNKEEKLLKDKLAGKPKKPPQSAYGVFSQMMMQSEEMKKIEVKHRLKSVAEQWKNCTEDEKKRFKDHSENLLDQYRIDYQSYLDGLSEIKRQQEMESNTVKRRKPLNESAQPSNNASKKKQKVATITSAEEVKTESAAEVNSSQQQSQDTEMIETIDKEPKGNKPPNEITVEDPKNDVAEYMKIIQLEPPPPPMSGLDLFSTRYHGRAPVQVAWRKLIKQEKTEYQIEVQVIKAAYIKDYEAFLKSLTKEQLTIYSRLKKKPRVGRLSGEPSNGK